MTLDSKKEVREKLKQALELLGPNGENWIKGKYSHFEDGRKFYCGIGACRKVGLGLNFGATLAEFLPDDTSLVYWAWQDESERTFAEVREVFLKSIAAHE